MDFDFDTERFLRISPCTAEGSKGIFSGFAAAFLVCWVVALVLVNAALIPDG